MTASKQPHPKRCETCIHYQPYERYTGDCKILDHWLKTGEYELITKVGCASHSSQPVPEPESERNFPICGSKECIKIWKPYVDRHRKAERERVEVPLVEWLKIKRRNYGACNGRTANDDPEDADPYDTVLRKIESLRGGEP